MGFGKDIAKYAPSQFLPAITAFITTPILTRLLPPAEYGYWAMALSISAFLVALAGSGLGSAVLRFYPVHRAKSTLDVLLATIGVSLAGIIVLVGGASMLALLLFRGQLPRRVVHLGPLVVLIFAAQSIVNVLIAAVRAQGRSGLYTLFVLTVNYGGLGIGLLLVCVAGFGIDGLLLGSLIALVLTLPFLAATVSKGLGIDIRRYRSADAAEMWQYAWPLTLGGIAMWGLRVSDLFVIRAFRPARDVGIYSVSYNISARSIELLVTLFLLGVSPLIYSTWETEGKEATEAALSMVTRTYLVLCLPPVVGLFVLAHPFVAVLTAPEYREGARIVGVVVLSSFLWGLSSIAMMGLTIAKKARMLGTNQIVAACVHITLMLLFVPRFGYVAAAFATLVGYSVLFGLQAVNSRRYLSWHFPWKTLRNVAVASAAMGIVVRLVSGDPEAAASPSGTRLVLSVTLGVVGYVVGLWSVGEITSTEVKAAWLRSRWVGARGHEQA